MGTLPAVKSNETVHAVNSRADFVLGHPIEVRQSVTFDKAMFDDLLQENASLKVQVTNLNSKADLLRETVRVNDITIAELREENLLLKEAVAELKSNLTGALNEQQNAVIIIKLQISIQDLNHKDGLATQIHVKLRSSLNDMKNTHIGECRYLVDGDSADLTSYKKHILRLQIDKLNKEVTQKFGQLFDPELLPEIWHYLRTTVSSPPPRVSPLEEYNIETWWKV
jgi:hypothetical protein